MNDIEHLKDVMSAALDAIDNLKQALWIMTKRGSDEEEYVKEAQNRLGSAVESLRLARGGKPL